MAFYDNSILPIFAKRKAMVYVLPDIKPVTEVFGRLQAASMELGGRSVSSHVSPQTQIANGAFGNSSALRKH